MLIRQIGKVISPLVIFSLVFTPVAFAEDIDQEIIATVEQGEPAPFSGTLFSTSAAASLLADLEISREVCQVRIDREIGIIGARHQLEIDNLTASLDSCETRNQQIIDLKDQHIEFLDSQLVRSTNPNNEIWLATGVVLGLLIGIGSAWSYGQVVNR
jgi:hypothetical protein